MGAPTSLTPEIRAKVDQLSNIQKNFSNTKKMNGPGVQLSLKEVERSKTTDRTLIKYRLYAEDQIYTLFVIQIDGSVVKNLEWITLDFAGQAVCAGREGTCEGDGPNDPIDLVVFVGKSEAKRFALVSNGNAQTKAFVSVQPFPNAATDKACKLESVLGTPNGELTFIQATGFEPNSALTINSQSYDEKHDYAAKADADGAYFTAFLPAVTGKKSGKTIAEVISANCSPKLHFQWGENSYHLE